MEELHFTGNCLKGSRPILSFDASFDTQPYLRVIKELLLHIFGVPKGARKTKPFVDHVLGFTIVDGSIWIRCYQTDEIDAAKQKSGSNGATVTEKPTKGNDFETSISLVEIGPRFVLTPIVILEGSFGGPVIYENKQFVSPNQVRSDVRRARAGKHNLRNDQRAEGAFKRGELGLRTTGGRRKKKDPLDDKDFFA